MTSSKCDLYDQNWENLIQQNNWVNNSMGTCTIAIIQTLRVSVHETEKKRDKIQEKKVIYIYYRANSKAFRDLIVTVMEYNLLLYTS